MKDFGSELEPYVILRDPKGVSFKLRLLRSGLSGYLREGLEELKGFYGLLDSGGYLSLYYVGNSYFEMTIKRMDLSDVEYPESMTQEIIEISSSSDDGHSHDITTEVKSQPNVESFANSKGFMTVLTKHKAKSSNLVSFL